MRTSLRTFCRYCHEAKHCASNLARLIGRALCGSPPPRALSDEETGWLLMELSQATGPVAERDHALFALMLGSGVGWALALDFGDLDLDRGEMRLRKTKGDVPVTIPLSRAVCDQLRRFVAE